MSVYRSTLFYGVEPRMHAELLACRVLGTTREHLETHPDYRLFSSEKESIGVNDIVPIFELVETMPAGEYAVAVIDGMDRLTPQAGNKLLKLIEDSETLLVFGACYTDGVLETLKSRMRKEVFYPASPGAYAEFEDGDMLYYATRGQTDKIADAVSIMDLLKAVYAAIRKKEEWKLLVHLGLVKEKDGENFYQKHKEKLSLLLNVMEAAYLSRMKEEYSDACYEKLAAVTRHKGENFMRYYCKDDFFSLFVELT